MEQQDVLKLIVSATIGAAIGLEREYRGKIAGFKTMMMICLGSTLFTIFSIKLGTELSHDRIAANIITGIGFIGAGAIFKDRENMISGLTTATIIWIIAAIGMGVGSGEMLFSIITAMLVLLLMILSPILERKVDAMHKVRSITVRFTDNNKARAIEAGILANGLKVKKTKLQKHANEIVYTTSVSGNEEQLKTFVRFLLEDKDILGVEL